MRCLDWVPVALGVLRSAVRALHPRPAAGTPSTRSRRDAQQYPAAAHKRAIERRLMAEGASRTEAKRAARDLARDIKPGAI